MKKFFSVILAVVLAAALLVGCGAKKTASDDKAASGSGLKDGTYKAESKPDERGYKKTIELTVANGKISKVVYDEISKDGKKKSEDEDYKKRWQEQKLKTADPKAFYEKLAADLVAKQDVDKVDAITGATSASNGFKEMAKEALKQAK